MIFYLCCREIDTFGINKEHIYRFIKRCPLSTFGYTEGVGLANLTGATPFLLPFTY